MSGVGLFLVGIAIVLIVVAVALGLGTLADRVWRRRGGTTPLGFAFGFGLGLFGWIPGLVGVGLARVVPRPRDEERWWQRASTPAWYLLLGALAVVVLFPVYFAFVRAISKPTSILGGSSLLYPRDVELDVFSRAIEQANLGGAMGRSMVVTVAITIAQVLTSVMAAYAFAYLWFPFKRVVFVLFMATLLLPLEVTVLPNLATISNWGWRDSYQGLIAPFLATALGTFLIRQAFLGVPSELRDAARLEGWSHWKLLTKLAIPLSRPVIAAFVLISFLAAYNQYLWPRIITTRPEEWGTAPIAVQSLTSSPENANLIVAGSLVVAFPMVILLILFQKQIVRGLTAGAVKG